jgi:hypothetical protein
MLQHSTLLTLLALLAAAPRAHARKSILAPLKALLRLYQGFIMLQHSSLLISLALLAAASPAHANLPQLAGRP